jgi:hypothetical protein
MSRPARIALMLVLAGTALTGTLHSTGPRAQRTSVVPPSASPAPALSCGEAPVAPRRRPQPWEEGCSDAASPPALAQQ